MPHAGSAAEARARALYAGLLERVILPQLGDLPLRRITSEVVRRWYDRLPSSHPTQRAHAYSLLRTLVQATQDGLLSANPCQIAGAAVSRRARRIEVASPWELATIVAAMPERLRLLVLLAARCGLR